MGECGSTGVVWHTLVVVTGRNAAACYPVCNRRVVTKDNHKGREGKTPSSQRRSTVFQENLCVLCKSLCALSGNFFACFYPITSERSKNFYTIFLISTYIVSIMVRIQRREYYGC